MTFKIENLDSFYGDVQILRNLSLELPPGQVHCLFGRNGAGKTTLMKSIMGLVTRLGTISLGGKNLVGLPAHQIPGLGVGYVPQGRRLFAELTVAENLEIGMMANPVDALAMEQIFEFFPLLKQRLNQISGTLSGGEQQMLAMARAFCSSPQVMLLDEPTEGLMPSMIATIREAVTKLRKQNVAILLVEQRVDAVLTIADQISFIENGKIKANLTRDEVSQNPQLLNQYVGFA